MIWDVSSVFFQVSVLASLAGLSGGLFCLGLAQLAGSALGLHLLRHMLVCAVCGVLSVPAFFLVTVGAVNQSGWQGMFDSLLIEILLQSGLGTASKLRLGGFAFSLLLLGIVYAAAERKGKALSLSLPLSVSAIVLLLPALFCLCVSFTYMGHTASLAPAARFAIISHIFAFALWAGSLYPLWYLCRHENSARLQIIMQRFGRLAAAFVVLLLGSGIYLLFELLSLPAELFSTAYGRGMLLKLLLVSLLLLLAAGNKYRRVPALQQHRGRERLQRAIMLELLLVLLILAVVSVLTGIIGI